MNQKGFAPIAIGILIAVLLASYFLYQKQFKSVPQKSQSMPTATVNESSGSAEIANLKTHTNKEGNYSFQYPPSWVVEVYDEKYPYDPKYDKTPYNPRYAKAHVLFQSRATTAKEKEDDKPGLPVDMATGSIDLITVKGSFRVVTGEFNDFATIPEEVYFDFSKSFWPKGNVGGGGPGYTYSNPEEVKIAGKRAIKQDSHPTRAYEWVGPNQIETNYYVWLGNGANEVIQISFTYDNTNPNTSVLIKEFNQILSTFKFLN